MKNTINDLNNILFEQIERLNDDKLHGEELKEQLRKANEINGIAKTLVESANISIKYMQHCANYGITKEEKAPALLTND